MATAIVSQPDRVAAVLATAPTWVHGRRKSDGAAFWILPSSDGGRTYYANERGCTCPAARNGRTGDCKHQQAIREFLAVEGRTPSLARVMAEARAAARQAPAFECPARGCHEATEVAGSLCVGCADRRRRLAAELGV